MFLECSKKGHIQTGATCLELKAYYLIWFCHYSNMNTITFLKILTKILIECKDQKMIHMKIGFFSYDYVNSIIK